jgi:hypothetical protein
MDADAAGVDDRMMATRICSLALLAFRTTLTPPRSSLSPPREHTSGSFSRFHENFSLEWI